jgi:hypothetical protein
MKEALTLALEALEAIYTVGDVACVVKPEGEIYLKPVIDKCKAALAQQERPWVGLTDREIDDLYCEHHDDYGYQLSATGYERAIEAKLKEKNT